MALGNYIALIEISMVGVLRHLLDVPSKLVSKHTSPDDIEGMFIEIHLRGENG